MLQRRFTSVVAVLVAVVSLALGAGSALSPGTAQAQGFAPALAPPAGAPGAGVTAPGGVVGDPYTVESIDVDVTSSGALDAREKAVAEAQRKAFGVLFQRLSDPAARRNQPNISGSDLSRLVQGLDVDQERSSANRYVARLAVAFRRSAVRNWFASQGLALVEPPTTTSGVATPALPPGPTAAAAAAAPPAGPTLVLPVWRQRGRPVLMEERTPWRSAWDDFAAGPGNGKVAVPAGELQDVADIGAAEALAGEGRSLAKIAGRYKAPGVAVVFIDSADRFDPAAGVTVSVRRFSPTGESLGEADSVPLSGIPNEKPAALLARATALVADMLAKAPPAPAPESVVLTGGADTDLLAAIPLTRLQEWLEIRGRLTQAAVVTGVDPRVMSRPRYEVVLHYRGDPDNLRSELERVGLVLRPVPPGTPGAGWELTLRQSGTTPLAPGQSGNGMPGGRGDSSPFPGRPAPL